MIGIGYQALTAKKLPFERKLGFKTI